MINTKMRVPQISPRMRFKMAPILNKSLVIIPKLVNDSLESNIHFKALIVDAVQ